MSMLTADLSLKGAWLFTFALADTQAILPIKLIAAYVPECLRMAPNQLTLLLPRLTYLSIYSEIFMLQSLC